MDRQLQTCTQAYHQAADHCGAIGVVVTNPFNPFDAVPTHALESQVRPNPRGLMAACSQLVRCVCDLHIAWPGVGMEAASCSDGNTPVHPLAGPWASATLTIDPGSDQ